MPSWTTDRLHAAISTWQEGQLNEKKVSIREVGRAFSIPEPTLRRYISSHQPIGTKCGPQSALSVVEEERLVLGLLKLHAKGFPATRLRLKLMVLNICRDGRSHQFSALGPSRKWVAAFLKRHSDRLSMRKSRILDAARADSFDGDELRCFFAEYEKFLRKTPLEATMIYNCDETGIDPQGGSPVPVIAKRGAKAVSSKRGPNRENTSVMMAVSAAGAVIPPLFIYKGKRLRSDLLDGAPAGSKATVSDNAFMDVDVFGAWLDHFVCNIPPFRPVLLILDNHSAHVALEVLEKCKLNRIEVLSLPPHTTHILQPLDAGYFRSFKSTWRDIVAHWAVTTNGASIQKQHVARLVGQAITRAWTPQIAKNSWASTGIWPLDAEKALSKSELSKNAVPQSRCAAFVLTDDPLPIANLQPRHLLRLKREGIDISMYRSLSITQSGLNTVSPPKAAKGRVFLDIIRKRLLTHDDCMAEARLRKRELEDKAKEMQEKLGAAALKKETMQREKVGAPTPQH